jgi:hypothetical protein
MAVDDRAGRARCNEPFSGDRQPWTNPQNHAADRKLLRKAPVDDGVTQFTAVPVPAGAPG